MKCFEIHCRCITHIPGYVYRNPESDIQFQTQPGKGEILGLRCAYRWKWKLWKLAHPTWHFIQNDAPAVQWRVDEQCKRMWPKLSHLFSAVMCGTLFFAAFHVIPGSYEVLQQHLNRFIVSKALLEMHQFKSITPLSTAGLLRTRCLWKCWFWLIQGGQMI